jgi:cobalt-zinc-cadmium efflux system outer membrane protein
VGSCSLAVANLLLAGVLLGCTAARPAPPDLRAAQAASLATEPTGGTASASAPGPRGEPGEPDPLLAALLVTAERSNPRLQAARRGIDVATAAIWQAELPPNPTLLAQVEDLRLRAGSGHVSTRRVGLGVPVVVGGRLRAARTAAEAERDVSVQRYLWTRSEVLLEVRRAYVALAAAQRLHAAASASRDLAAGLVQTAQARREAQVASASEVLSAQTELARAESDVEAAAHGVEAARRILGTSVGTSMAASVADRAKLASDYDVPAWESLRGRITSHPLVRIAQNAVVAACRKVDLARAERTRDLDVEVSAGESDDGESVAGLTIGVPLPIHDRNQARIAAAYARRQQALAQVEATRRDVERRAAGIYRDLATAEGRARRYATEILPVAETALEQSRQGYEAGKYPYLDVVDARRTLSQARIAYVGALSDLNRAAQEVESYLGLRLVARNPKEE